MAKREPTLEERETKVAEQEAAIAAVLPIIAPALTKISGLFEEYERGYGRDRALLDTDPGEYFRRQARMDAVRWVLEAFTDRHMSRRGGQQ